MLRSIRAGRAFLAATALLAAPAAAQDEPLAFDFDRIAPGFIPETFNDAGYAEGDGFAEPNPWGPYTAYLMATNEAGQRTWRIENYLPRPGQGYSQGSTMYLVEGEDLALLIDTAQPAETTPGVNDLKTLVRFLLGRDNSGAPIEDPLDFVVANTHSHGDHTGENDLMSDRTIYYMDLDWPEDAPANYVPIREGGGATANGGGTAVGEIDLGGRVLRAIAVPPHTAGSTAYLDEANSMLFSGDALGSGYPFLQGGPITTYQRSARHAEEVTRDIADLVVLPAHSYQIRGWGRSHGLLGRAYVEDSAALADELVSGTAIGESFATNPAAWWARHDSAQIVYSLDRVVGAGADGANYHAALIGNGFERSHLRFLSSMDVLRLDALASTTFIIRERDGKSLYLVRGSESALLIGSGGGSPGLAPLVERLAGGLPLDVVLLNEDEAQTGGLAQLSPRTVYALAGGALPGTTSLEDGDSITLGKDACGADLVVEAHVLGLPGGPALTLLSPGDQALFLGDSLGALRDDSPLTVADPLAFQIALNDWWSGLIGRAALLYPSTGSAWYTSPDAIADLNRVLLALNQGRTEAQEGPQPGWALYGAGAPRPSPLRILAPAPQD